jgi:hypothetical protein
MDREMPVEIVVVSAGVVDSGTHAVPLEQCFSRSLVAWMLPVKTTDVLAHHVAVPHRAAIVRLHIVMLAVEFDERGKEMWNSMMNFEL